MTFIDIIQAVSKKPTKFFTKVKKEKSMVPAMKFLILFIVILYLFVSVQLFFTFMNDPELTFTPQLALLVTVVTFVFGVIMGFVGMFIRAGIRFFFLWLFKGTGDYIQTFNGLVYSYAPFLYFAPLYILMGIATLPGLAWLMIISIIPIIGAAIWIIWLECTAMSIVHKMSKWRAFLAMYIVPLLVIAVLIGIVAVGLLFVYGLLAA